ncbi:non-ribosomal peptide synthetase, partial [Pseudomonas sp. RIT623]|uniref:non-ribosomal peptide synthetase n=1 Tax=Pseudomonas sp. RIT623 TaxID=2559075 RepID=UPI0010704EF2
AYVAPRSELEQRIAQIWQEVLKVEQVGLHDNFFELGGDSIISIQVVSRARQAGIRFTPKALFQHQTVADLAAVAQVGETTVQIDQKPAKGQALLLPFQQVFFDTEIPERHHWNQSVLLKPAQPLDAPLLDAALQALVRHHDALRLRFQAAEGGWQAHFADAPAPALLWRHALGSLDELEALAEQTQRSLDLENGPLLRALLVTAADGQQRLLLVIHHLAVDGVSWRILFEDLQALYAGLLRGEQPQLPARTSSVQAWAERLHRHADSDELRQQQDYWRAQLLDAPRQLPCLDPQASLSARHASVVRTTLDKIHTTRLLQEAPAAYRTQVNDLLLTALARVVCRWTGDADLLLQMEGHGREALFDDIDLTRTVGWFTSLYPVRLTPAADLGASIKGIKEQLRALPHKGIGYGLLRYLGSAETRAAMAQLPVPRITFNYLGQFDGSFSAEDALFIPAAEAAGSNQHIDAPLGNWLTLNGQVYDGVLSLTWSFSERMFAPATIEALAAGYREELEQLVGHCAGHHGVTPSDFPLARVSQQQLDALPLSVDNLADLYPLSAMQQGMLFHTLYDQASPQYINQMQLDVEGLDPQRFRQAWQAALDAHDILRSGFHWGADLEQPLQWVARQVELPCQLHDWRARPDLPRALQALADAERAKGFDLGQAPLLRLQLVRTGDNAWHLVYTSHHILMDGWSNSQLLGEVLQRYNGVEPAREGGRYRDYIAWLQGQDAERTEVFWREQLQALHSPTRLASVYPHVAATGHADHYLRLDQAQSERLSSFARQHKVTLNTVVQAAWLLMLQRYTGHATVAFGATVAGRPAQLRGIEQQIGLFINTLPVIASPRGEQSVASWLQQVQAHGLALREFEHTPLADVQRWAGQGGEALFDSLLVFENYPVADTLKQQSPEGLSFGDVHSREQTSYPLTVLVAAGAQLGVQFSYDRAHFGAAVIAQFAGHLKELLQAFTEQAGGALGDLPWLDKAEQAQLMGWNSNAVDYPRHSNIGELFQAQVARTPQALAVTWGEQQLSYAELEARANRLAHKLREQGVGPESRVGIACERNLELVVGLLAILKAGAAYVPLDPDYPAERVGYMLQDSGAQLLLTQRRLAAMWPSGLATLCLDELALDGYPEQPPQLNLLADNLAYVIYTSGSTGQPKGVAISHRNVAALVRWSEEVYSHDDLQGVLASTSVCFDLSVWELFVTLARGGSLILARNALELPQLPAREQVRLINSVPSAVNALLRSDGIPASVRIINLAGEPLKQTLVDSLYALPALEHVYDLYGPSEDTTYSTWTRRVAGGRPSIGKPLHNSAAHLLDADLQAVPVGVAAELYLSGAGVTRGYLGRAALTAEKFVPNPHATNGERMYRSGDLIRRRGDGDLEYIGRIDHQVKIRGFRIELGEIEARLLALAQVREAAVLAHDGPAGAQLVAYLATGEVPPAEQQPALRERIRGALAEHLPGYMLPSQVLFLAALPQTPNGKLDRKALPPVQIEQQQRTYVAPQGALESDLATLWAQVLGVARIGRDDNFFELGGHSLLVVNLVSRIHLELGMTLTPQLLFQYPTLATFAAQLNAQGAAVQASTLDKLEFLLDEMEEI